MPRDGSSTSQPPTVGWFQKLHAKKSLHASPIAPPCGPPRHPPPCTFRPTSRLLTPWNSSCVTTEASKPESRHGFVYVQRYICIRGEEPSGGVPKFALLPPPPS